MTLQNAGIRQSLDLLQLGEPQQMWPLLAAVYAAPLEKLLQPRFVLWLHGPSGTGKSTVARLLLEHFGDSVHVRNLTADATPGMVKRYLGSAAGDLRLVDDFAILPDAEARDRQEQIAESLVRLTGDGCCTGTVLATAEFPLPGVPSFEARSLQVPWHKKPVFPDGDRPLTDRLIHAMHGYRGHIKRLESRLRTELPERVQAKTVGEARQLRYAAQLYVAVTCWTGYALLSGAVGHGEAQALEDEAYEALFAVAAADVPVAVEA